MFDEFSASGAGLYELRYEQGFFRTRNGRGLVGVGAVDHRAIDFAHHLRRPLRTATDDHTIRIEEIGNGRPLPQKFRIGNHLELAFRSAVQQHGPMHPFVGVYRYGALLHHQLESVDRSGNVAGNAFHVGKIGSACFRRRRSHGDKNDFTGAHCLLRRSGKGQALAAVAADNFWKKLLMNRNNAGLQCSNFLEVIVSTDDLMANLRKRCSGHQADVPRSDNCNFHLRSFCL